MYIALEPDTKSLGITFPSLNILLCNCFAARARAKKDTSTTTTLHYVTSPRTPFGEGRGYDGDFGWTHTFEKKAFKTILSVTLDIRARALVNLLILKDLDYTE